MRAPSPPPARLALLVPVTNLSNAIIGAGVLVLPFTMGSLGLGAGCALIGLSALMGIASCTVLFYCARSTGSPFVYGEIAAHLCGPRFGAFVESCQVSYSLGSCVGYLVIVESELLSVVLWLRAHGFAPGSWANRELLMAVVVFGCVLPLSSVRSLHALRYSSLGAVLCVSYVLLLLAMRFCNGPLAEADTLEFAAEIAAPRAHTLLEKFKSVPLLVFAFNCQVPFLPIVAEMGHPSWRDISGLLAFTFAGCAALYWAVALLGFLSFGETVEANVIDSFADSDTKAVLARIAMVLVLIFSFPLYLFAIRLSIGRLLLGTEDLPPVPHCALTAAIVLGCAAVASRFETLEVPLGLTGALAGSCIVFVIPGILLGVIERRALIGSALTQPSLVVAACERARTSGSASPVPHRSPYSFARRSDAEEALVAREFALIDANESSVGLELLDPPGGRGTCSSICRRRRASASARLACAIAFGLLGCVIGVLGTVATLIPSS
ncbi:transmembrane amino acid transporter protein-domain-containing protein [Pavlovales sp. CCMP2436]|nr:transmembrane amino acid transporter protein-domain-containing protein [Pavlovales sp. CCMP2436]|mmetsp:Transcript_3294/g.8236  ORF Transcript_3294/g.8236 Transcript_3294/m.8236 type:complete len:495 (-) Transcript_3294:70-1554(-)